MGQNEHSQAQPVANRPLIQCHICGEKFELPSHQSERHAKYCPKCRDGHWRDYQKTYERKSKQAKGSLSSIDIETRSWVHLGGTADFKVGARFESGAMDLMLKTGVFDEGTRLRNNKGVFIVRGTRLVPER